MSVQVPYSIPFFSIPRRIWPPGHKCCLTLEVAKTGMVQWPTSHLGTTHYRNPPPSLLLILAVLTPTPKVLCSAVCSPTQSQSPQNVLNSLFLRWLAFNEQWLYMRLYTCYMLFAPTVLDGSKWLVQFLDPRLSSHVIFRSYLTYSLNFQNRFKST